MPSTNETLISASRAFVHSLNALLKSARLYGLHHARSERQLAEAWKALQAGIGAGGHSLLVGTSGSKLVLDGAVLESTAAENSLAQIFANAGVASVLFTSEVAEESFRDFVKAFAGTTVKPSKLHNFLRDAFGDYSRTGIRINELRVGSGNGASDSRNWLRDPSSFAELISAKDGSRQTRRFRHFEFGEELLGTAHWEGQEPTDRLLNEDEAHEFLRFVVETGLGKQEPSGDGAEWKSRFDALPASAKSIFRDVFTEANTKLRLVKLDEGTWFRLATDVAIRCAIERFESSAISANDIRPLIEKMARQIQSTAKTPSNGQSIPSDSLADVLERQFWAAVSPESKQSVLLSPQCWCVPPKNIQQQVRELRHSGNSTSAEQILMHYARSICHVDPEVRRKAANGVMQIADTYLNAGGVALDEAVRAIGEQLSRERDAELQSLLSTVFVRFGQRAAEQRELGAVRRTLDTLGMLEKTRPSWTRNLRPRIGINDRIPQFIEEGLRDPAPHPELIEVLRRTPEPAATQLSERLMRVMRASERESLVAMACAVGEPIRAQLRQRLELAPISNAVRAVGLLSRVEPIVVEELLPQRIRSGQRATHDEALRQLSIAGAPERGRTLTRMLGTLDPVILPMAVDEIGMCGDASVAPEILRVAQEQALPDCSEFLRVKAIEALGRLRASEMEGPLLQFVEARATWRWTYPHEMRVAAAQALVKLDPERAPALLANSGLDARLLDLAPLDAKRDRDFVRYRRYTRVRMPRPIAAVIESSRGKFQPSVQVLSLEGGLLSGNVQMSVGTSASLRISSGIKPIRLEVLVRFAKSSQAGVETVGMELEDRSRLRNLLLSAAGASVPRVPVSMPF
jgi:hypothetical protein